MIIARKDVSLGGQKLDKEAVSAHIVDHTVRELNNAADLARGGGIYFAVNGALTIC